MDFTAGQKLTATRLNQVLQARCHAYQIVAQTLTTGVAAAITFTAEAYDPFEFHSTSSNTSRITPNIAGTYRVIGQAAFAGNTTGDRTAHVRKNGSGVDSMPYGAARAMQGTGLAAGIAHAFGTVSLNGTTDYVELWASQNSGGNLNTEYSSGFTNSFLIVERIGD